MKLSQMCETFIRNRYREIQWRILSTLPETCLRGGQKSGKEIWKIWNTITHIFHFKNFFTKINSNRRYLKCKTDNLRSNCPNFKHILLFSPSSTFYVDFYDNFFEIKNCVIAFQLFLILLLDFQPYHLQKVMQIKHIYRVTFVKHFISFHLYFTLFSHGYESISTVQFRSIAVHNEKTKSPFVMINTHRAIKFAYRDLIRSSNIHLYNLFPIMVHVHGCQSKNIISINW